MKISKISKHDLENIKENLNEDFDDFWSYDTLIEEFNQKNSYFIVAKSENGEIIGFSCLKKILDEANIMNIVVKKSFRHCGIGSSMLEHLINFAKNKNMKTITLEVNEHNLSAIHLYDKFNFNHLGIRKKYYHDGSDAVIMTKKL